MMNIAILASGNGSNFQAIVTAQRKRLFIADIKLLITDKETAFVRHRAKKLGVKDIFINPEKFKNREEFDKELVEILKQEKINLVVLAGFMRILSPYFIKNFKDRIINIHPAILPAFKGVNAIKRAFDYGCKVTGITVHFVEDKIDHGPIILQETITITPEMDLEKLEDKIHRREHKLYPFAVKLFAEKKLRIKGRNVTII